MANLIWRSIDQNDLEEIIELSQGCHAVDGGIGFMFEPEPIKSRYLPDGLSSGIGAYAPDGHLAACACVSINGDPGRQRARIVGQVRPDVRGRGIGTYLMQWSQEQARLVASGAHRWRTSGFCDRKY